jgi:hypothetical protein
MMVEKPVIATNYSGNIDFTNGTNSHPVSYSMKNVERDFGPYIKGDLWAEPNIEEASKLMRYVYENRKESRKVGKIARNDIINYLSPNRIGEEMRKILWQ